MSPIYTPGKLTLAKTFTWNETIWNPSMISTALWLDAADASTITESGGAVSQWNDKSGNGRNATQSTAGYRPTSVAANLNGKNVLHFDGTDDFLQATNSVNIVSHSMFILARKTNAAKTTQFYMGMRPVADARFYLNSGGVTKGAVTSTTNQSDNTDWQIVGLVTGASSFDHCINGNISTNNESNTGTATMTFIGGGDAFANGIEAATVFAEADIAEVISVASVVSSTTRQKLEGYLAHKWGLTANLPNDHPYKTVGPTP